jgi:hypothetical protein
VARTSIRLLATALIATIALLGIAACVAIHFIVSTRTLRNWVNTSPEDLFLDYESGSAWVPGIVRIRGLTMRGSDRNVQWSFRMEDAVISVSLLDLLHKEFHATRVRGNRLVFRLREREEKATFFAEHRSRVPKIPGFADPPLPISTPEPPPPDAKYARRHFWSVRVENFVADPTPEVWVELYRFQGHARVTGSFYLHPHVEAWIGPAAVQFLSGDLSLGSEETVLRSMTGRSDCVIEPHAPDEVRGDEIWRKISGSSRIEGRLEDLRFLNYFLRRSEEPRFTGGAGPARFDVRFDHGIGKGGADFEAAGVSARYAAGAVRGRASGHLEIPRWDVANGDMEISGSRVDLSNAISVGTSHDERDWWGRFQVVQGRLRAGLQAQGAVSARDARPLYTLFRANLPGWAQGVLKLDGLRGQARVRVGSDLVDVEDMDATGGSFHIAGRYRQKGKECRGAFLVESGLLAVGVAIDGDASHVKLLGARKWFEQTAGNERGRTEAVAAATHGR